MKRSYLFYSSYFRAAFYLLSVFPLLYFQSDIFAVEEESGKEEKSAKQTVITVPDDYKTIQEAINAAKSGDKVRVRSGNYNEALNMKDGIILLGQATDKVIVSWEATKENSVIYASNCASGSISKMTFEFIGSDNREKRWAVVNIVDSAIAVKECVIKNGVGNGFAITGNSSPIISNCIIESNTWSGIFVQGKDAKPLLSSNQISKNGSFGISFEDGSGGSVLENTCINNKFSGILIDGKGTKPAIRNNRFEENLRNGITYQNEASGVAEKNICRSNKDSGIVVVDSGTTADLKGNNCSKNEHYGIYFGKGAGGTAGENLCEKNKYSGIAIDGKETAPTIKNNKLVQNKKHGLIYFNGAKGVSDKNLCESNGDSGIAVYDKDTSPNLKRNKCSKNKHHGIYYADEARGIAEENICEENGYSGFAINGSGTNPVLRKNKSNFNSKNGFNIWGGAEPKIEDDNIAEDNVERDFELAE